MEKTINRETAVVSKFDKQYCTTTREIKNHGVLFENRTGIDTYAAPEMLQLVYEDIEHTLPILESKKTVVWKALVELFWIHQAQSNDVRWLEKRGAMDLWFDWMIDEDGIYRIYEPEGTPYEDREVQVVDTNGVPMVGMKARATEGRKEKGRTLKKAIYFGPEWAFTIGTAYGWINNRYKKPQEVLRTIKNDPNNRRMKIDLWNDEWTKTGTLPPCVWGTEWAVIDGKLHCKLHQRSADMPLGYPFNVVQYALLLKIFAHSCGLEAGNLYHDISNAHIYVNQFEGMEKHFKQFDALEEAEKFIQNHTDREVFAKEANLEKEQLIIENAVNNGYDDKDTLEVLKDVKTRVKAYKHLIYREKPEARIVYQKDFFKLNNIPNTDPEYLAENATGNKNVKVLHYTSMPGIKMPLAQ